MLQESTPNCSGELDNIKVIVLYLPLFLKLRQYQINQYRLHLYTFERKYAFYVSKGAGDLLLVVVIQRNREEGDAELHVIW
jgi:hypothetical protein